MAEVRVRMAPTPSGLLHLGTAHTALFNWLFARHHGGKFILRIDDTDPKRYKKEYEEDILEGLKWLGIDWDEGPDVGGPYGPYRQSERMGRYWKYVEKLLREKKAYYCYCDPDDLGAERKKMLAQGKAPKYSGKCRELTEKEAEEFKKAGRKPAVRLKVDPGEVSFVDPSRGKIMVRAEDIGDFIIARGDKSALLALATTIDDIEMKISHTIRGEDYLNFVPRQILLYRALGVRPPTFVNLAFVYGPDGTKLSKRHGATAISEYREQGYLPEALVNYLVLLGWSPKDDREILEIEEIVRLFDLKDVRDAGPRFDFKKLEWLDGQYIQKRPDDELAELIRQFLPKEKLRGKSSLVDQTIPLIKTRICKLADYWPLCAFLFEEPEVKKELFKGERDKDYLKNALSVLEGIKEWNEEGIRETLCDLIAKNDWKTGDFFMAFRIALSGSRVTPPITDCAAILGRKGTLSRLQRASGMLEQG